MSTAGSLGSGLASSRASRWLRSSPKPFLVPLPRAVAPSRDTEDGLSLSGCFLACRASHVGSCRDFPDGCLAPASSPSGWTSSWSTKLGQHISLAPALRPWLHAPAPSSCPGAIHLSTVPQPPCLGDDGQAVREWDCKRRRWVGTESCRDQEVQGETCRLSVGRLGRLDWLGESGPGGQRGRRSFAAATGGRAGRIGTSGDRHLLVPEPRERHPLGPGRGCLGLGAGQAEPGWDGSGDPGSPSCCAGRYWPHGDAQPW